MIRLPETVNILGTEYRIEVRKRKDDKLMSLKKWFGYTNEAAKLIVILDFDDLPIESTIAPDELTKCTLRHEIVHAFLNESGLSMSANPCDEPWSKNEEMVDWMAIQGPKIFKVWNDLGIM